MLFRSSTLKYFFYVDVIFQICMHFFSPVTQHYEIFFENYSRSMFGLEIGGSTIILGGMFSFSRWDRLVQDMCS